MMKRFNITYLKKKFVEASPTWLYCFGASLYWALYPRQKNLLLLPLVNCCILIRRDGSKFFVPPSCHAVPESLEDHKCYYQFKSDETVLDIGAGIGGLTIPLAKKVKKIVAIEPEPTNVTYLQANITKNRLKNVRVVEKAVWNCRKTLKLHIGSIFSHSLVCGMKEKDIKVQGDTLDNIISEFGVEKIDFAIMDVEGAEIEALEGARNLLSTIKGLAVETHIRDEKITTPEVKQILEMQGLKVCVKSLGKTHDMVFGERK